MAIGVSEGTYRYFLNSDNNLVPFAWCANKLFVCRRACAGKYADMVVLSADPRTVPPECIADLEVRVTFLAGRQVYAQ